MSSLVNTLRRCHSTVRGLMISWPPISGFVRPSPASRARHPRDDLADEQDRADAEGDR
jgi:hypothetical protein